ncbi:hypothetical protein GCM10028808_07980 [Spirosoma migulaei]
MKQLYSLILLAILFPNLSNAQSEVYRLGNYQIGVTTPDSLRGNEFKEDEQSYVKGTIALPCTHIRTFTALTVTVSGIAVSTLSLAFYDNRLFRISCDYSDQLQKMFSESHGKGTAKPAGRFSFCGNHKPMLIWGNVWQADDQVAFVVRSKGYNADCAMQETSKLIIASQRLSALASDCELKNMDPSVDEFEKMLRNP